MATVATDGEATTGLTATTVTTERGPQMLSLQLSPLLLLTLTPTLMRGTDTTDTVATDGVATTGLTATTDTMERGLLRLSQSLLLPLIPMLMLMPGTATTERGPLRLNLQLSQLLLLTLRLMLMLGTGTTDTGVTGAKPTNREVDSSSDCDFPSTLASISRACA